MVGRTPQIHGGLCPSRLHSDRNEAPASDRGRSAIHSPFVAAGRACLVVRRQRWTQPWRCLWRGSEQMTMTRPCRRITRHLLQIRLTLGLTFTGCYVRSWVETSLVSVDDAATGEVVRGELHDDPIFRQDTDVVLPHLAADVRQDLVAVGEFHPEHGVREWLDNPALDLDGPVFFGHVLRYLTSTW